MSGCSAAVQQSAADRPHGRQQLSQRSFLNATCLPHDAHRMRAPLCSTYGHGSSWIVLRPSSTRTCGHRFGNRVLRHCRRIFLLSARRLHWTMLQISRPSLASSKRIKVLVLGSAGAGKSSAVQASVQQPHSALCSRLYPALCVSSTCAVACVCVGMLGRFALAAAVGRASLVHHLPPRWALSCICVKKYSMGQCSSACPMSPASPSIAVHCLTVACC